MAKASGAGPVWEEMISLNARSDGKFEVLGPARDYKAGDTHTDWSAESPAIDEAVARDSAPLPITPDREGYYGPWHYSYWASGHRDARLLREACDRLQVPIRDYLDFGCASGRVLRHMALSGAVNVIGCDINRRHVDWVTRYLPGTVAAFQNHSIPNLPLPDNSLDLVSAFTVFTHIEAFETAWLMELRRILRPGGIAWVTVHTERTWAAMAEGWPLFAAMKRHPDFDAYVNDRRELPKERMVFRWRGDRSYSSNVFYERAYLHRVWGRLFDIAEEHHRLPGFQDVVVLRKT